MMKYKMLQYKDDMLTEFWFIPLSLTVFAFALSLGMATMDELIQLNPSQSFIGKIVSVESIKIVMPVIATATITMTVMVFSITVLILSIAANQLGPRLLPNFMRQNTTQFVFGFFIATFVYSIMILQIYSSNIGSYQYLFFSELLGLLFGIVSVFLLIYFIHFICHVIQIDTMLDILVSDLISCLKRLGDHGDKDQDGISKIHQTGESYSILLNQNGYIQYIDYESLFNYAVKNDIIIKIEVDVGAFIFKGLRAAKVLSKEKIEDETIKAVQSAFILGRRRTPIQDIKFSFEEISEIAVRALSTGINSPYTAIHCFDRITQGIAALSNTKLPASVLYSDKNVPVLYRKMPSYNEIIDVAINTLREKAKTDLTVTIYMLKSIEKLLSIELRDEMNLSLKRQAKVIYQDASRMEMNDADISMLKECYDRLNIGGIKNV